MGHTKGLPCTYAKVYIRGGTSSDLVFYCKRYICLKKKWHNPFAPNYLHLEMLFQEMRHVFLRRISSLLAFESILVATIFIHKSALYLS